MIVPLFNPAQCLATALFLRLGYSLSYLVQPTIIGTQSPPAHARVPVGTCLLIKICFTFSD
jgi:hypothetical protein